MRVWLTEKIDQAKNIAPLLGNHIQRSGYFDTDDGRVTWAIGHLLQQANPEQYNPAWEQWSFDALPMVPSQWRLLPDADKERQLGAVLQCVKAASEVVIATDCGQEGEAIARELLEHAGYTGKVRRLWYSALDDASLRKALASIRDGSSSEPLYWASQARARADWLIGMNLSRAYTLRSRSAGGKGVRSIGRVQTPTLALVVRRDLEIEAFVSRTFYDIEAVAETAAGERVTLRYSPPEESRIYERTDAEKLAAQLAGFTGPLAVEQAEKRTAPPKPLNLTALTRLMSKRFGWSADKTLDIAQKLYDKKLTTYPRTPCQHLPEEQIGDVQAVLAALGAITALARPLGAILVAQPEIRKTVFNTAEVNKHEHHAIIPTVKSAAGVELSDDEQAAYALIARHYIALLMPDYRYAETRMTLTTGDAGIKLAAVGRVPLAAGWKAAFDAQDAEDDDEEAEQASALPDIKDGCRVTLETPAIKSRKTSPPKRYTEGELVADMEAVAKYATNPEIKKRLKENAGIGTDATRASIVKTLRDRAYIEPQGKHIVSTAIGRELIGILPSQLTDPTMTALWEERLAELKTGQLPESARDEFVAKTAGNITRLIDSLRGEAAQLAASRKPSDAQLAYARKISDSLGVPLPENAAESFGALKAFLDTHAETFAAQPPTPAQLALAEKVAAEKGIALPDDARTQRGACGAFLDQHAPKGKSGSKKSAAKKPAAKKRAGAKAKA